MTKIIDQVISRPWNRLLGWAKRRTKEGLLLGFLIQDGKVTRHKLYLPHEKRTHHLELLGKTGMGKSSQVCGFIKQDIEQDRGFAATDFHGDLTDFVLATVSQKEKRTRQDLSERLIIIDPSDLEYSVGLNVIQHTSHQQVFIQAAECAAILEKHWNIQLGARTSELLRNCLLAIAENHLTLLEVAPFLTNASFRSLCLRKATNPEVKDYFEHRYNATSDAMQAALSGPVLNKLSLFTGDPHFRHILGQPLSTFNVLDAIESGRWVVLNLNKGRLGEHAVVLASLFMSQVKNALFARKKRKIFSLYCDEVQNLVASEGNLETLLSECRKFSTSVVCAHQFTDQLTTQVRSALGAIGSHIYFQLSSADAQHVATALDGGRPLAETLKNLPPRQILVKSGHRAYQHALVPTVLHLKTDSRDLYERCRKRWGLLRTDIESEITKRQPSKKGSADEVLNDWQ